jgi:hypothetical protein
MNLHVRFSGQTLRRLNRIGLNARVNPPQILIKFLVTNIIVMKIAWLKGKIT